MTKKFPTKAPVYTTEPVYAKRTSRTIRVNIYKDGVYCCQLMPKEVSSWLYKAEKSSSTYVENEAYFTVNRIIGALEYLAARAKRPSAIAAATQMELF